MATSRMSRFEGSSNLRQAQLGVDVDLGHAVLDGLLDVLVQHAAGRAQLGSMMLGQAFHVLEHARGAM
jgi:hypothetical protein